MDNPETQTTIKPPSSSRGAAIMAILFSLVAIGLSARNYFCESVTTTSITQQLKSQDSVINDLRNTVVTAQKYKPAETSSSLASIHFYIADANVSLTLNHDPKTAIQSLQSAEHIIASQSNTVFHALNKAIQADIQALQSVSIISISATYTDIETLKDDIVKLSSLPEKPDVPINNTIGNIKNTDNQTRPWHKRLLHSLQQVKNLFVIRHTDQTNVPLLDTQLEMMIKQNSVMQLNIAEWALLHRNQTVYQSALHNVSQQLLRYFSMTSSSLTLIAQLNTLQKLTVQPILPTLNNTLNALAEVKLSAIPDESVQSPKIESPHPLLQPKIFQQPTLKTPKKQPKNQNPTTGVET